MFAAFQIKDPAENRMLWFSDSSVHSGITVGNSFTSYCHLCPTRRDCGLISLAWALEFKKKIPSDSTMQSPWEASELMKAMAFTPELHWGTHSHMLRRVLRVGGCGEEHRGTSSLHVQPQLPALPPSPGAQGSSEAAVYWSHLGRF